ncbi:hypothetical protein JX265_007721 [Neoarthrinium moseri]|uniref:Uncharacterized protein n=1 Tax=Neoarthrinium moseri TaxID=1658444 RepID=A0A9P9WJ87_9PEZI|nr:hypothetical protein JX265_007721 [Neoarthrinium moseri]
MKAQNLAPAILCPFVAYALPNARRHGCGRPPPSATATSSTTALSQTSSQVAGYPTLVSSSGQAITPGSTVLSTDLSTSSAIPTETLSTTVASDIVTVVPSSTATLESTTAEASTSTRASQIVSGLYSEATQISFKVPATEQCGNNDILTLPGMPWVVANSMYNADQMVGSQCTNFESILEATDGTREVVWNSVTDIDLVDSTKDLCKGYTNIGVGVNLNKKLSAITSIPAFFQWSRTNTTEFRGSNVFDFITAPTPSDTESTATSEFMLWIRIWGGQVPIGYAEGPVATLDLFGASWKLYEGQNPASGVTVRSLLVDEGFDGVFQGDLKDWLDAMAQKGYIADSDYVTVGNAGSEVFYGSSVMNATVALDIKT